MHLDQIFCLFHTKVLSVHAVAVLDDSVKELDMVSDGKILGISDIFFDGFIHSLVELAMGGVVEAIWEALKGPVVQVAPNHLKRLYIANGAPAINKPQSIHSICGPRSMSWDDECARGLRTRADKPFVGAGDEDSN